MTYRYLGLQIYNFQIAAIHIHFTNSISCPTVVIFKTNNIVFA